jgi:hypothetical protein
MADCPPNRGKLIPQIRGFETVLVAVSKRRFLALAALAEYPGPGAGAYPEAVRAKLDAALAAGDRAALLATFTDHLGSIWAAALGPGAPVPQRQGAVSVLMGLMVVTAEDLFALTAELLARRAELGGEDLPADELARPGAG